LKERKKREILVLKYSQRRKSLLLEFKTTNTLSAQMGLHKKIEKLPRNSSRIRLRNRCWRTGSVLFP
ncbi:unnamed protein product, partial [Pylaiella littoralis]